MISETRGYLILNEFPQIPVVFFLFLTFILSISIEVLWAMTMLLCKS